MAAWVPQLVVRGFLQATLSADAGVLGQIAATQIIPDVGVPTTETRTLAHEFSGSLNLAAAIGGTVTMATMTYDVTGWEPSHSRLSLAPLMAAVKTALIGADMRGRTHLFSYGGQGFAIDVDQNLRDAGVPIGLDQSTAQTWAPVRERYSVTVRPRAA